MVAFGGAKPWAKRAEAVPHTRNYGNFRKKKQKCVCTRACVSTFRVDPAFVHLCCGFEQESTAFGCLYIKYKFYRSKTQMTAKSTKYKNDASIFDVLLNFI